jgi:hypothetical protein
MDEALVQREYTPDPSCLEHSTGRDEAGTRPEATARMAVQQPSNHPERSHPEEGLGKGLTLAQVPENISPLVDDAIHLIVHLTGNGDPPRQETISDVFSAKKAIQDNSWSIEITSKFLAAYSELSKQAKPITARSLLESEGKSAKYSLLRWSSVVWILLPFLVILSAISYANNRFIDNAYKLIDYSYVVEQPGFVPPVPASKRTNTGKASTDANAQSSTSKEPVPGASAVEIEQEHRDAIREIILQIVANGQVLNTLSQTDWLLENLPDEYTNLGDRTDVKKGSTEELTTTLRAVRMGLKVVTSMDEVVFGILATYVLPLLCALLGSAAYGLRSLSERTLSRTFRLSRATYARAILAVIVGFAVGLFSEFTARLSLTPLATAFLAGYAVEPFFIFLDAMLESVQKPRHAEST